MNKLNQTNKQKGFTIIEVVLVLAIAGLIFLIVFLALPGLQKSRRDTQRKSDVGRMIGALTNYQSTHSGNLPGQHLSGLAAIQVIGKPFAATSCSPGSTCVIQDSAVWKDPSGEVYINSDITDFLNIPDPGKGFFVYSVNNKCKEGTGTAIANYLESSQGAASILMPLESGDVYCQDTGSS